MRSRVRWVSSNVMLPELPDAKMDTRNPIGCPQKTVGLKPGGYTNNFQNHGRAFHGRQRKREITIYVR